MKLMIDIPEILFEKIQNRKADKRTIETVIMRGIPQEPKTGQWIYHFDESGKWYECDQCHTDWGGSVNYCPNCGARMESEET